MLTTNFNWGKIIFLGMGPAVYLGFWMPATIVHNPISMESVAFIFLCCAAMSAVYYLTSLGCLQALQKWVVPAMKKHETYEFHKKYGWLYALFLGIPAAYMGFFAVAMTYGCPGGTPEFNIFQAIGLFIQGWGIGAFSGAASGVFVLPFLDLFKVGYEKLSENKQ